MFGVLKVRIVGDPCLRAKSKPVKAIGPVERMLIAAMFETMQAHKGIGLAAPQVGVNEQIFVVDTGKDAFAVINPKILKMSGNEEMEEGCLSIPNVHVNIQRAKAIEVEFTDEHNQKVRAALKGLAARVFQHESDHLSGKLIIDYLPAAQQKKALKQMKEAILPAAGGVKRHDKVDAGSV